MEPGPGLSPLAFSPAERAALEERLRRDHEARDALTPRRRAAVDGLRHALAPDSMDPALPPRHLLAYDLQDSGGPTAAVCAGDPATATHLTWMVSGMGIRPETAMWGAAHEAAHLWAAQRAAGAPRPVTVAWLRYAAPSPWRVVLDAPARAGGERLAEDVAAWWEHVRDSGLRARGTAVHGAVDAHSYGTLVAAHALAALRERGLVGDDGPPTGGDGPPGAEGAPPRGEAAVETLVVSGAVGLPAALVAGVEALSRTPGRVFRASAPGDLLSLLGRLGAWRRDWPAVVALPVSAGPDGGFAVRGHGTSRWRPEAGEDAPRGYRDPGSVTLASIARVTAGQPLQGAPGQTRR